VIQVYVKKGNPLHVVGHIAYRTWTDNDKVKHHQAAIVIGSFTLLGRPAFKTSESLPESDDGDATVVLIADGSSKLTDNIPFFQKPSGTNKGPIAALFAGTDHQLKRQAKTTL